MRGHGCVVALVHPRALAALLDESERRLEEVHEQPHRPVQSGQRGGGLDALEAAVSDHPAHDGAVLLLDPGLVVLAVGPRARERDLGLGAPGRDRLVHEHAVVVGVEAEQREGQRCARHRQHLAEEPLLAKEQRRALGPAGGDVGEHERLHERAPARWPAVRDEIGLHEAGCRVVPVCERPHRHAPPHGQRRRRPALARAARSDTHRPERPVDRGRADRLEPRAHPSVERQMPVALHRREQHRDQRLQPLAADPVRRLPEQDQRLAHRLVVEPTLGARPRAVGPRRRAQHSGRVLAVVACHRRELRQDAPLLHSPCLTVPPPQRVQQLVPRRHAHPPHLGLRYCPAREQS